MVATSSLTKAILVQVIFPQSADLAADRAELESLAMAAELQLLFYCSCRRKLPDSKYFLGSGKVTELSAIIAELKPDVVVFNHTLTPIQGRNLEKAFNCAVIDRTQLILQIFAKRAQSFAGKLQVELARLEHEASRLVRGWTHLERQRGGGGFLGGPGEKQIEMDRRVLKQKIVMVKKRLVKLENQQEQNRHAREQKRIPTVALVGYTNAGKSTTFNLLNTTNVTVKNMLFTTLDLCARRIYLPDFLFKHAILIDTVGFIRELPHELIKAFHATLEEVKHATLILHLLDAADPHRNEKRQVVNEVLTELSADTIPQLEVWNKIDTLENPVLPHVDYRESGEPWRVWISARTGEGKAEILRAITELLNGIVEKESNLSTI